MIGEYLGTFGLDVRLYPGDDALSQCLRSRNNRKCSSTWLTRSRGRKAWQPQFRGAGTAGYSLYRSRHAAGWRWIRIKFFIKELLQRNRHPRTHTSAFTSPEDYLDPTLRFPVISKLNAIHGSVEIARDAVSENEKQLRKRLRKLIRTYRQPVLVEEFVSRREITAIVLEGNHKKVYLAEKIFRHPRGAIRVLNLRRPMADRDERSISLISHTVTRCCVRW